LIQLNGIELDYFLSHKSTSLELDDLTGLIMVDGANIGGKYDSNGAGKSTLLEGIVYNISGQTLRKSGANGMVNRQHGKDTRTKSKLTYRGKTLEIERFRSHSQHGDALILKEDGVDISKRLNKETQAVIDSMLGMSYQVLTSTIFLGEGLSSKFTQLSDGDKKTLIESTLNLAYDFGASRNEANTKLKAIRQDLANSKGRITSLESVLKDLDKQSLTAKVADLTALIQASETSNAMKSSEYQSHYTVYNDLNNQKTALSSALTNLSHLESNRQRVMSHVSSLKDLWSNAGQGGECEVCKQSTVSHEAVHNSQTHYMSELQEQGRLLEGIQLQIDGYGDKESMQRELESINPKLQTLHHSMSVLMNEMNQLTGDISRMRAEVTNSESLLSNSDKYETEVEDLKVRVSGLETSEKIYAYWYDAFSPTGLLTRVLNEAVHYLNERIEIYSEMLLDRKYRLNLSKGKLSLVDDANASYETLSNGEKRRLDLAIQFGLHDYVHTYCGIQVDTLFIDEVLDTLDGTGISNIIDILRMKLSYCNLARIFVITHNQDLKSYFDRVVLVSKGKDEYSTLQII
jgi:DNA repair exonuclease SbcCD ATPase subunit